MHRILDLPFLVILMGIAAIAMYLPAVHALLLRDHAVGRAFFYSGTLLLVVSVLLAVATANYRPRSAINSHLVALVSAYLLLPPLLAIPFREAVAGTPFLDAWFEMVSSFTTTGATLYDLPGQLPPSLHLWRGLVGWLGGFIVLVTAAAILAPLSLGGFEVSGEGAAARSSGYDRRGNRPGSPSPSMRLTGQAATLLPVYAGLTGVLWVGLLIAGDPGLVAFMHAMATLSTSGISPIGGVSAAPSGIPGEVLVFAFLSVALSRHILDAATLPRARRRLPQDAELRLGLLLVGAVPMVLFLRHWIGALDPAREADSIAGALHALWGGAFTVMSFLTTTGFESLDWSRARAWSGLEAPGLILVGLVMVGGGIATTAGGVKLLRVYALYTHGVREIEKLVHPSSIGGHGEAARRLRSKGAFAAWVFFMLFASSIAVVMALLALAGLEFEAALVFTISALSTAGPLAGTATEVPLSYADLNDGARAVLAATMVLGRLETLAIIALFAPGTWRR